jgi:hypothetical protein
MLTLDSLELDPHELEVSREAVRRLAYWKWQRAGCPPGDGLEFWLAAEREWIERYYVPHREPDLPPDGQVPPAG